MSHAGCSAANPNFGFISTPGGFVFQITGSDFQQTTDTPSARADNIVLWTQLGGTSVAATNFFMEWVDNGGTWHSLSGGVTAGDIADEAQDRGLQPGDFQGFEIKADGGDDTIRLDGGDLTPAVTNIVGILPGSAVAAFDVPPMIGSRVTVDGNAGNDRIFGSPEDDIIRGGPGDNVLAGGAGNDTMMGGPGNDVMLGGGGADKMDGDDGRDLIMGQAGDDTINGGAGHDGWMDGNNENGWTADLSAFGLSASQKWGLFGGDGNDTIDGGDGADDLSGDARRRQTDWRRRERFAAG